MLISMRIKCNHRRTFCRKPRLQKCPQSRVLANLAKTPKSAILRDSSKGGPRENRPKSSNFHDLHDLLISMRLKCNHRTTLWCKPRIQKCPQSRVLENLVQTPKLGIFWDNLVSRVSHLTALWGERGETLVWSGHVSARIWQITIKLSKGGAP